MPFFIFKNTGETIWIPSDNGVTDGTQMRVHGIGPGAAGDIGDGTNGGGGGGGGERRSAEFYIGTASNNHSVFVGTSAWPSYESTYFYDTSYQIYCFYGERAFGTTGGAGGSGGTGTLIAHNGGSGGDVTGSNKGGAGGGESGQDGVAGATGAAGGATNGGAGGNTGGASLFGVSDYGIGGDGGSRFNAGNDGSLYGGGGGGSGADSSTAGLGAQGLVIAAWGATLTQYPTAPFIHGYVPDPSGGASTSGWWLLFSWLFGQGADAVEWANLAFDRNWNPNFFQTLILKRYGWLPNSLNRCCIMHAWRNMTDVSGPSIFKEFNDALHLYGTRREWQKRLEQLRSY